MLFASAATLLDSVLYGVSVLVLGATVLTLAIPFLRIVVAAFDRAERRRTVIRLGYDEDDDEVSGDRLRSSLVAPPTLFARAGRATRRKSSTG